MPDIVLSHVQKSYGAGSPNAVSDLDLHIGDGEFMCLLGPSGCGKTTTLRMIAGLENLTDGEIGVGGKIVDSPARGAFIGPEKRGMGLVFQSYALWPHLTIERNTDFGLRLRKMPKAEREARVAEALEEVGLGHVPKSYPWQLSGGMQQRVAIARAIAYQPEVLLMDEPFAAVDAQTRADLEDLVRKVRKDLGISVLFVTHDIDESVYLAERVIMLSSSPTVVQEDLVVDLPAERDQLNSRSLPRFTQLRHHVYEQIQLAKKGFRPDDAVVR